jgi:hypothetical protein
MVKHPRILYRITHEHGNITEQITTKTNIDTGATRTPSKDGHEASPQRQTRTGHLLDQMVFPGIDDGSKSAEEIKKELRASRITMDLTPRVFQFEYSNRSVLSSRNMGGWYSASQAILSIHPF